MTNEELLTEIDANSVPFRACIKSLNKALRAVVELHKPQTTTISTDLKCSECSGLDWVDYPCSTIQAIENGLK